MSQLIISYSHNHYRDENGDENDECSSGKPPMNKPLTAAGEKELLVVSDCRELLQLQLAFLPLPKRRELDGLFLASQIGGNGRVLQTSRSISHAMIFDHTCNREEQ